MQHAVLCRASPHVAGRVTGVYCIGARQARLGYVLKRKACVISRHWCRQWVLVNGLQDTLWYLACSVHTKVCDRMRLSEGMGRGGAGTGYELRDRHAGLLLSLFERT